MTRQTFFKVFYTVLIIAGFVYLNTVMFSKFPAPLLSAWAMLVLLNVILTITLMFITVKVLLLLALWTVSYTDQSLCEFIEDNF